MAAMLATAIRSNSATAAQACMSTGRSDGALLFGRAEGVQAVCIYTGSRVESESSRLRAPPVCKEVLQKLQRAWTCVSGRSQLFAPSSPTDVATGGAAKVSVRHGVEASRADVIHCARSFVVIAERQRGHVDCLPGQRRLVNGGSAMGV
eukprot:2229282-Pleurochrysis_carterae.AAC.3